ncbi:TPA: hypothetical protein SMP81_003766 [Proteus mirabilis]|uniref:hypothetical protein n=1 Tax=Proteus mirabilis TaxID=584 RepID=UPI0007CD233E|nr:hypothetical protein [Proteus mirabilis]MBO8263465.1 hypothetical protein [Proteus mirabilis]MBO8266691.1 hypothetical protein [Proteus mirabilis]MBO8271035.1 hypothetical protein [Proteus mirabilis]MBO8274140.1 hypothetical protein [Proteus mirabilis]MBO8277889.1 hypothetical protein [Proteus mirabilis]
MNDKNIIVLLKGKTLLKELSLNDEEYRAWLEIVLQDKVKPAYPFRTEPNAMIGHSPYSNICDESKAKFKVRTSYFLTSDIENGFDPSYDRVGKYIYLSSIDELFNYLNAKNLKVDDFIDSSMDDDYPL